MSGNMQPRGKTTPISNTGSYTTYAHGMGDVALTDAARTPDASARFLGHSQRLDALARNGYVPATILAALDDPRSTARRKAFWEQHFLAAEHAGDGERAFPKMPDDYTPNMTGGQGLSGHRRTHRMCYTDADLTFRMPSVTSVKRYATETRSTFDVPVTAMDAAGRPVSAWVRVTNSGTGAWAVEPIGFSGVTGAKISEAIAARLESRRPSFPPADQRDLIERHKERLAKQGGEVEKAKSSWIEGFSYLPADGVMVMRTSRGGTYGYQVDRATFERVRNDVAPGVAYNALIKNKTEVSPVATCDSCGRVYAQTRGHQCPTVHKVTDPGLQRGQEVNRRQHGAAIRLAGLFRRRDADGPGEAPKAAGPRPEQ